MYLEFPLVIASVALLWDSTCHIVTDAILEVILTTILHLFQKNVKNFFFLKNLVKAQLKSCGSLSYLCLSSSILHSKQVQFCSNSSPIYHQFRIGVVLVVDWCMNEYARRILSGNKKNYLRLFIINEYRQRLYFYYYCFCIFFSIVTV